MPKFLFDNGRDGFLTGSITWMGATVVPYVIGSFNVNASLNTFLSDVPAAVWRARGTYLSGRGHISGIASAASAAVVAAVGSAGSATGVAVILVAETGASQTSLLISYDDTMSGLPFLPNGSDVQIDWDVANGIFKL